MKNLTKIKAQLQTYPVRIKIVLPEGTSSKIQMAAVQAKSFNIDPVLIFDRGSDINSFVKTNDLSYRVIEESDLSDLTSRLHNLRQEKCPLEQARKLVKQRNYFSTMLLKLKNVDGLVGGIEFATKDIIRPALQIIKCKPNVSTVASYFFMSKDHQQFIVGDCALNIDPSAEQLSIIGKTAFEASQVFLIENPQMAFLSYSTKNSGVGPSVDKVKQACQILKQEKWDMCPFDGEFQLDSAINYEIQKIKCPNSALTGPANILIFPNIDAGNIGYKIMQRLGGYQAVGPILLGTSQPVNDLSRGASITEIVNTIAITAYIHILNQK